MKKNNFKKIFVVFSLCVFLLSLFSISSFAMNISEVDGGHLYKFTSSLSYTTSPPSDPINVKGYLVNKSSGDMTAFTSLIFYEGDNQGTKYYYFAATTANGLVTVASAHMSHYDVYIDYSKNTVSQSSVESLFSQYFNYTVTAFTIPSLFNKVNIALSGGTNGDGVSFDGFLGMISKFGKFLVSSPLLLVLCIALPLVSFSVGLIIRIKNRA